MSLASAEVDKFWASSKLGVRRLSLSGYQDVVIVWQAPRGNAPWRCLLECPSNREPTNCTAAKIEFQAVAVPYPIFSEYYAQTDSLSQ